MHRAGSALIGALLLASAACSPKPGGGAAGSADSTAADSLRADSLRRASTIGHDSAFGPTHTIDANGKVVPIKPPG